MNTRRLLSDTVLYGVADIVVLAVGGFLLLPLYTRTMSQEEFGIYVIVRANTDIFTYLLFLGLPSAVARVYFDYKQKDEQFAYLSSVLLFFLLALGVASVLLALWGDRFWRVLSPATRAQPYLWFCVALAALSFFSALATLWLRMEGRAATFAMLQVAASVVLVVAAVVNLVFLGKGLDGLLLALLISSACSALILPWLFGKRFRPRLEWQHVSASLHYALPIMLGYVAYFLLNRMGTLILQRHVDVGQVAVFGLAQQLAMMVGIAAAAFGKAAQPAVFGAGRGEAADLMRRAAGILIPLMFWVTASVVLFAADLFAIVAPPSYDGGVEILLLLLIGNYAYSFTVISDTALLYHRRPKTSVAVTIFGAACAFALGLWLIPRYQLYGAAFSILGAMMAMAAASYVMAYRATGHAYVRQMVLAVLAMCVLALLAAWLRRQGWPLGVSLGVKLAVNALVVAALYLIYVKGQRGARASPALPT